MENLLSVQDFVKELSELCMKYNVEIGLNEIDNSEYSENWLTFDLKPVETLIINGFNSTIAIQEVHEYNYKPEA